MRDLIINERVTIPAAELELSFSRSGGPGGQNVNKVESKVEVRWRPGDSSALSAEDRAWLLERLHNRLTAAGELLTTSSKTRDQAKNRSDALDKMENLIRRTLVRPKTRRPTRPTRGAVERRLEGKKQAAQRKRGRRPPMYED